MSTHGGDSFPGPNTLFGRVHRVSRSLVPSSRWFRSFVPSFRSLVPSFRSFVPYLQIHHNVLALFESWLTGPIPNGVIDVTGYNASRQDREWSNTLGGNPKRGGGQVMYIRKGLKFSDTKHSDLNTSCADLEMQWLETDLVNVRPIVIVNVYRPPQGDPKRACKLITEAFMKASLKDNAEIYLLGDFNIDFDDKKSTAFKELEFTAKALDLVQLTPSPTRFYYRDGTLRHTKLDLFFSNSDCMQATQVLDLNISDHLAVMVTRKKIKIMTPKIEYKNYNKEDFQEALVSEDCQEFYNSHDPNFLWGIIEGKIMKKANEVCPLRT